LADIFDSRASSLESPGLHAAEITPDDTADLETTARALWIGTGGTLRVTTAGGETVTFRGVVPGVLPVRTARVHATGTTAGDIVAVW
jgi:hypothetical protein